MLLLFMCNSSYGQFARWDWAHYATGGTGGVVSISSLPAGNTVCTDATHNVYVLGNYGFGMQFDTLQLNDTASSQNLFLAKYDASGTLLWVKNSIPYPVSYGNAMNIDNTGNIYI